MCKTAYNVYNMNAGLRPPKGGGRFCTKGGCLLIHIAAALEFYTTHVSRAFGDLALAVLETFPHKIQTYRSIRCERLYMYLCVLISRHLGQYF
jgi:hypothetical protein